MTKQIKIKDKLYEQLTSIKDEKDSYSQIIQTLIDENKQLQEKNVELNERVRELKQDKEFFIEINKMRKARHIKHNALLEKEDIELLLKHGVNDFYREEYKTNIPNANYSVNPLELVGLASIVNALYEIDIDYDETYDFDKNKLFELSDRLQESSSYSIEYKKQDYEDIELDDFFYQILKCNCRDYNVKDDLIEYLRE